MSARKPIAHLDPATPVQIDRAQAKTLAAIGRLREATGRLGSGPDQSRALLTQLADAITDVLNTGADLALAVSLRDCRERRTQIQRETRKATLRRHATAASRPHTGVRGR